MKNRIPILVLGAMLGLLSGPSSVCSASVEEPLFSATTLISVSDDSPVANAYFLPTQIQILQSLPILNEVANRLDLQKAWGKDGAALPLDATVRALKGCVHVDLQTNTTWIAISVERNDPDEAALIANEIANTYRDSRLILLKENARRKSQALVEVLADQLKRVEKAKQTVDRIKAELTDAGINCDSHRAEDNLLLQQLEKDQLPVQSLMMEKEALLKWIESEKDKSLIDRALSLKPVDPAIASLVQQLQEVEKQHLQLQTAGHGESDPETKRLALQKEAMEKVLAGHMQSLEEALKTEYRLAKENFDRLNQAAAEIHSRYSPSHLAKLRPLRTAQANLESEELIYKHLEGRVQTEKIALDILRNPVEIIEVAKPGNRPTRPTAEQL